MNDLEESFRSYNAQFKIISTTHLRELHEEIETLCHSGKISDAVYNLYLKDFEFVKPKGLESVQSIIIIAIHQKISLVTFQVKGKNYDAIIPPTYIYGEVRKNCIDILSEYIKNSNKQIFRAVLPFKLLAVRSGLGKYGRNNLCYVQGMGSYNRLEAFYLDFPFKRDDWQEKRMLEQCEDCIGCEKNCPLKCIKSDDIIIDAGRCLTYFNENESDFPEFIDPRSHNALVGCMKCQTVCPENRAFSKIKERIESFNEEETNLILKRIPKDELPEDLQYKLKGLNMEEYYYVLARNLKVLINRQDSYQ